MAYPKRKIQISRPVHVIFKSDKLDYLRCPRKEIFFDNFFSIEQGPSNVGKLNWDLLGFFHSFSVSHGVIELQYSKVKKNVGKEYFENM